MKNFKGILTGLAFVCFFFTSDAIAQEKWGKSGKELYEGKETITFDCPCSGEFIQGTLVIQENGPEGRGSLTWKGHKFIGVDPDTEMPSGNIYNFSRVDHFNPQAGMEVWKIRTKRMGDGLVTNSNVYLQDGQIIYVDSRCK